MTAHTKISEYVATLFIDCILFSVALGMYWLYTLQHGCLQCGLPALLIVLITHTKALKAFFAYIDQALPLIFEQLGARLTFTVTCQ